MHRLSTFIKTKWYNQDSLTRDTHLDKLVVLHESPHFLAVNKHHDLVFNVDPPDTRLSLYEQIGHKFPHLAQPRLVHGFHVAHRLDFSTSGVVIVPLYKKAAAEATKQFMLRTPKKYYIALVWGEVMHEKLDIRVDIGPETGGEWAGVRMAPVDSQTCDRSQAKESRTRLMVLERGAFRQRPATKVLMAPITGRRHQLRVHCDYIGHTIVGDYTYSDRKDVLPPRMFLHAHRLVFRSKFEDLDITAEDLFTNEHFPQWKPQSTICDLESAFEEIHSEEKLCDPFDIVECH